MLLIMYQIFSSLLGHVFFFFGAVFPSLLWSNFFWDTQYLPSGFLVDLAHSAVVIGVFLLLFGRYSYLTSEPSSLITSNFFRLDFVILEVFDGVTKSNFITQCFVFSARKSHRSERRLSAVFTGFRDIGHHTFVD